MPESLSLPPRSASVSVLLDAASRIWRATLLKCLPLAMFAIVAINVPRFYATASGQPITHPLVLPKDPVYWMTYAVAMIVYLFIVSTAILRQRALLQTGKSELNDALSLAAKRLPALIAAMLLGYFAMVLGVMALVVPAIYISVGVFLIWYVMLFDTQNPWDALLRSVRLVHPVWWKYFASIVIALLVVLISVIMAALIINVVIQLVLPAGSAAARAILEAAGIGFLGAGLLFVTSLGIVLHSAASSSD